MIALIRSYLLNEHAFLLMLKKMDEYTMSLAVLYVSCFLLSMTPQYIQNLPPPNFSVHDCF